MKMTKFLLSGKLFSIAVALGCAVGLAPSAQAAPKKVLVVTVTKGFRHSSIPTAEKILGELAQKSGAFTVDYASVEPSEPKFKGPDGKPDTNKVDQAIREVLAEKMSLAALKKYDGVIFANTTGNLPLPDKQGFLDWIKSGKGFIGTHSASDTFHGFPPYIEMLGGEFKEHHAQAVVDCIVQDFHHPACRDFGPTFHLKDEIYLLKNFDPDKVHGLLMLDKYPNTQEEGHYPIAWAKPYGKGRVFYTSLGHREDVWDPNTPESFTRENPKEVSEAYQKHILGGIRWALGLERGDAKDK